MKNNSVFSYLTYSMRKIFHRFYTILAIVIMVNQAPLVLAEGVIPASPNSQVVNPNSGGALTLHQAVDSVIQNNPAYVETLRTADQVSYETPLAKSLLFPTLNWANQANWQKAATGNLIPPQKAAFDGNPYNTYSSSLTLNQPLFFYGSIDGIRNAEKDFKVAKLSAEITARNLTAMTVIAFYQIVLDTRNVDSLVRQQKILMSSLQTSESRSRTGRGQVLDVLQTKTQIALLKSQIATAANQVQIDAANLATLMGRPQEPNIQIPDRLEFPSLNEVNAYINQFKPRVLELEKNAISVSQIDDQISVLWGKNLPSLSLVGAYNFNSFRQSDLFDQAFNSWQVGLLLNIPLFSGFSTHYSEQALLSQKSFLETDRENIKNTVNYQQVTAYKQLETAETSTREGLEAVKLAKASSDEATRNYRLATIDFLNFLTVETAMVQAEQSLNNYKMSYLSALVNYYSASGLNIKSLVDFLEGKK